MNFHGTRRFKQHNHNGLHNPCHLAVSITMEKSNVAT